MRGVRGPGAAAEPRAGLGARQPRLRHRVPHQAQELLKYDYVGFAKGNARSCLSTEIDPAPATARRGGAQGAPGRFGADHGGPHRHRLAPVPPTRASVLVLAGDGRRSSRWRAKGGRPSPRPPSSLRAKITGSTSRISYDSPSSCATRATGSSPKGRRAPRVPDPEPIEPVVVPAGTAPVPRSFKTCSTSPWRTRDVHGRTVAVVQTTTNGSPRVSNMGPRVAGRAATPRGLPGRTAEL